VSGQPIGGSGEYYEPQMPRTRYYQNYQHQQGRGQVRGMRRPGTNMARAGTGEFLERRALVGNEIEIPKEDLDLAAAMEKLEVSKEHGKKETKENEAIKSEEKSEEAKKENQPEQDKAGNGGGENKEEILTEKKEPEKKNVLEIQDTVTITHGKTAYEKSNFFDDLNLDTNEKKE